MKLNKCPAGKFPLLLAMAFIATTAGCSSQKAPDTAPEAIKADMGGHYSPSILAQGRAYQQQDVQKQAQMQQQNSTAAQQGKPAPP